MKKLAKKGFTLVEMLVVIAIIAILVAIIIPTTSTATTKAKASTDAANLRALIAEATIDFLADDTINNDYKMTSKLLGGNETTIKFYNTVNGLVGVFATTGEGAANYTVDYFAKVAETGKKSETVGKITLPATGYVELVKGTANTTDPSTFTVS